MSLTYIQARKRSKALVATSLVLLVLLILSSRFRFGMLIGSHHAVQCAGGLLTWGWSIDDWSKDLDGMSHVGPLFTDRADGPMEWWFASRRTPVGGDFSVPLAVPVLGTLLPGMLIGFRHRFRPGHCRRCDYDLSGLEPGAPCPECGRAAANSPARKR